LKIVIFAPLSPLIIKTSFSLQTLPVGCWFLSEKGEREQGKEASSSPKVKEEIITTFGKEIKEKSLEASFGRISSFLFSILNFIE